MTLLFTKDFQPLVGAKRATYKYHYLNFIGNLC